MIRSDQPEPKYPHPISGILRNLSVSILWENGAQPIFCAKQTPETENLYNSEKLYGLGDPKSHLFWTHGQSTDTILPFLLIKIIQNIFLEKSILY